jgi:putative ABC transport system permease protein
MTGARRRVAAPLISRLLINMTTPPNDRAEMLGDLQEELEAMALRLSPRAARRWYWRQAVRSTLPNITRRLRRPPRSRYSDRTGDSGMQTLLHDIKYGLRGIRKHWAFSVVIVLTLTVGIGAITLVYSIVDGAILRPFPFPDPDRLIGVGSEWPRLSRELGFFETLSPREYEDVKRETRTMEQVVMWDLGYRSISTGPERPEVVLTAFWFDDAFPTLGTLPRYGRGFSRAELERGDRVAVVSHRVWQTRLGEDPAAIGRRIFVEGEPYTLIGIMPSRVHVYGADLWIPMGASPARFPRNRRQMQILARIKTGYSLQDVNTELAAISGQIEQEHGGEFPEYQGWHMRALTWADVNVRQVKPAALALLGAVAFALLIVCANVASLLLARAAGRRKELAVRRALGADRFRIVCQLLTESILLSAIGGILGVGITYAAAPPLVAALQSRSPVPIDVTISLRVLLVTGLVSVVAGVAFGLVPALHASRTDVQATLKLEGPGATGSVGQQRLQRIFVGAEFAVALTLLVQAGLLANSFVRMQLVDPGFDPSNTLTLRLTLPPSRYDAPRMSSFFQQLTDRVGHLPGVLHAGAGSQFPPNAFSRSQFAIDGEQYETSESLPNAYFTLATDGYLEALGVPVLRGRTFTLQDTDATPIVGVINEAAVRRFFPDTDPIGKRIKTGGPHSGRPWVEIVGVVGSTRNRGPEVDPQPEFFGNIRQLGSWNQLFLIVKTARDPYGILEAVQSEVAALDKDQPVYAVQTVEEAFATITAPRRLGTIAVSILATFALVLAAAGIYAVVSYGVGERTKEIGLRIALGASRSNVRRLVVRQAMIPVIVGGIVGLAAALASGRALSGFLFGVSGTDPLTVIAVAGLLAGLAALASYLPARRASRLDPTLALRNE